MTLRAALLLYCNSPCNTAVTTDLRVINQLVCTTTLVDLGKLCTCNIETACQAVGSARQSMLSFPLGSNFAKLFTARLSCSSAMQLLGWLLLLHFFYMYSCTAE
jgi:hypothetical protein